MAPALVLLHGFTHTGASWAAVLRAAGERYRALAPDIRGHGSAAGSDPVSLEAVLGDLGAVAPETFTLVGYSMGGRIALHAGLAWPERVERLMLVGASPGIEDPDMRRARVQADLRLAHEMETLSIEALADRWAATPILAGQSPAVVAAARRDRLRNQPAALAKALRGLGTGTLPSLWGRLDELPMTVDLVVGEHDAKFRATAQAMAARLGKARIHVVPGAGHAVHLEDPAAVAEILSSG